MLLRIAHIVLAGESMARAWLRGTAACILLAAMLASALPLTAAAQEVNDACALNPQFVQLIGQGKYAEAAALSQQALSLTERTMGLEHPGTIACVNNLAVLYQKLGRYTEAEPLYKRALAALEKRTGRNSLEVAAQLKRIVDLYSVQQRPADAMPLLERATAIGEKALGPGHPGICQYFDAFANVYWQQGRFNDAEQYYKRSLAVREKASGKERLEAAVSLDSLALLYSIQGRRAEAEEHSKRALAIREEILGPEHPSVAASLDVLTLLYRDTGRYAEAEPLSKRSLAIYEKILGRDHPNLAVSINNLALLQQTQGRYADAEALFRRSLAILEKVLGPYHPALNQTLSNLAGLYALEGRYEEAEPLLKRSLAALETALGAGDAAASGALSALAANYRAQGRFAEAEAHYRRALAVTDKAAASDYQTLAQILDALVQLYQTQNRYADAEALLQRRLAIAEKALGANSPGLRTILNIFASVLQQLGRRGEAERFIARSMAISEQALGRDHPDMAWNQDGLGSLRQAQGRYAEAEELFKRALSLREKALGPEHYLIDVSMNNLAWLYLAWPGRAGEVESLWKRSLEVTRKTWGPDNPGVGRGLVNLAQFYFKKSDWRQAADYWQQSADLAVRRTRRAAEIEETALISEGRYEASQQATWFWGLFKASYRFSRMEAAAMREAGARAFEMAQWAGNSEAAQSLAQMAVRQAKNSGPLAQLIRERQDLAREWHIKETGISNAVLQTADNRNPPGLQAIRNRLSAIETRIGEIDARLKAEFPNYAALANPDALPVHEVRALLKGDEALVVFFDTPPFNSTPEETFIWVVTKTDMRWVRSDLGTPSLAREVQALRCGLDDTAWETRPCAELSGQSYTAKDREEGKALPFDHTRAYRLYAELFGQVEDLIKGKQLLIVPSGPLMQLPFQVLVTAAPGGGEHKTAAWLIRDHALTVLPAISSLKALRRVARPSAAAKPMIGIGNPLLDGHLLLDHDQKHPEHDTGIERRAQRAREKQYCPATPWQRIAALLGLYRGVAPLETRGGLSDVESLRGQSPLPESADELCDVARAVGADPGEIRLGAHATEREVKRLSGTGQLAQYRIVHFATHGALAGQVRGNAEPGLLLTPPAEASEEDDGYLTASEIAALKLDADWGILSACNTAAGGAQSAEALSGLARAFIYAQARALLVSHWEVDSDATVKLVTGAMRRLAADKAMGRAEAMRQSMLALIDKGEPHQAHPALWAPFVLVGEGGAAK
jgi:CHAT domain-containing protein/tetratricopeptide (TPR) repeat protein